MWSVRFNLGHSLTVTIGSIGDDGYEILQQMVNMEDTFYLP